MSIKTLLAATGTAKIFYRFIGAFGIFIISAFGGYVTVVKINAANEQRIVSLEKKTEKQQSDLDKKVDFGVFNAVVKANDDAHTRLEQGQLVMINNLIQTNNKLDESNKLLYQIVGSQRYKPPTTQSRDTSFKIARNYPLIDKKLFAK